jgi:hypothetical protein
LPGFFQLRDFLKRSSVDFDRVELKSDDERGNSQESPISATSVFPCVSSTMGVRLYRPPIKAALTSFIEVCFAWCAPTERFFYGIRK